MALLVCVLLCVTAVIAFMFGAIVGETSTYHRRAMNQMETIEQFIQEHPEQYSKITVHEASSGYAYMMGSVDLEKDLEQLESKMLQLFGEEFAHEMTWRVDIIPREKSTRE